MQTTIHQLIRFGFSLISLLFGFNQFLHYLPQHNYPYDAQIFIEALYDSKYLFYLIGLIQIFLGGTLLFNRYIPLGLILFTPILLNAILFHIFMDSKGLVKVIPTLICYAYFLFYYKPFFAQLLKKSQHGIV